MSKHELGMNNGVYNDQDSVKDGYPEFEKVVKQRFESFTARGVKLFKTNASDIYDMFLKSLPEYAQQHYLCNACKSFFNKYGGLVTINEYGEMESVLWDDSEVPSFFASAVKAVKAYVLQSKVNGVFLSSEKTLGHPVTGEWTHVHAKLPSSMIYRDRLLSAGQAMAKKREEFEMVNRAMQDFSMETIDQALALINSETLYRGDKAKPNVEWLKTLITKVNDAPSSNRRNLVWLAVATAPTGFTHIRSSASGTLLKNIAEGLPVAVIASKFEEIMNPANYQRSQSAPSDNAIYEAEKIVAQLEIEDSLLRRYATLEEVSPTLWKPSPVVVSEKPTSGVFGHLKGKAKPADVMNLPTSVMTWEKFQRTVMPTADSLEVRVDNPNRFMALVTAVHPESENILQWDNTFSWYYHGGVDAEMKRRVEEAGGRYDNNEIRVSLAWEGLTDLDLHCITPKGDHIMYNNKMDRHGGFLDLDMNGLDKQSHTPVENMRWMHNAPEGKYTFYVHNYAEKVNYTHGTPYRVELEVNGKVYHYEGQPLRNGRKQNVFEFNYIKGKDPVIQGSSQPTGEAWNVPVNSFVKVNAVTNSPNLWGKEQVSHAGTHVFFLLEGVKDLSEGKGRGFFNEMLKPDLKQIRKTLELFTANTPIEDADEATACGVGYSKDQEWNLTVKVTSGNSSRIVKIDRWD